MKSLLVLTGIACCLAACSALDPTVRKDARQQATGRRRERPLFIAAVKDSMIDHFGMMTNGYFEYLSVRFQTDLRTGKIKRGRRIYHGAGTYRQAGDTLFLTYYKNYRPAYLTDQLFYSADKSYLYYYYAGDSSVKRRLPVRTITNQ